VKKRHLAGEREYEAAMKAGLIHWLPLVDAQGVAHRAVGPWQTACGTEQGDLRPMPGHVSCEHWSCQAPR
jgi:hypothetical protein